MTQSLKKNVIIETNCTIDFIFADFKIPQKKAFFNILLELKTKNVFLQQIKNNDTRFKHSLEPFRRY
ncbi:MAG: hypothetical protein ACI9Q9_000763 [Flavobacterium sp.]|jgi:hypothetical protein